MEPEHLSKILVYAAERVGITPPKEPLQVGPATLFFEPFETSRRFDEFDGIITFQGIFEKFHRVVNVISPYTKHECDQDALDKRKKEAVLLTDQGGFICFVLVVPFIDRSDGRDFKSTDLAKFHLSYPNVYRESLGSRITQLRVVRDEFRNFLQVYGAAWSRFWHYSDTIDWKVIAEVGGRACGMVINETDYFVPSLVPDNEPAIIADYFKKLATAIRAARVKLDQAIPDWVKAFEFEEELNLRNRRAALSAEVESIDEELGKINAYKGVLVWSGERLVEGISTLLSAGFGFSVTAEEEYREDLKLVDESGNPWCLLEVKGVNRGVNRESINQADSHRERSGFKDNFPTVLVMNVGMKAASTVSARDRPVAGEQIRHASAMSILVLRTIDLLRLFRIYKQGNISLDEVQRLFTKSSGWLSVSENSWSVLSGKREA